VICKEEGQRVGHWGPRFSCGIVLNDNKLQSIVRGLVAEWHDIEGHGG
jgi:hypothetical protein